MSVIELQAADLQHTAMGMKGSIFLTDTTAITGDFRTIYVYADAVFSLFTSDITKNGTDTAVVAADFGIVPVGTMLYGKFTAVTLTSGKVILYK